MLRALCGLTLGSFAPTTSVFKLKRMVPDEHIPGTLNVGHAEGPHAGPASFCRP